MTRSLSEIIDQQDLDKINQAIISYGTMSIAIAEILERYKKNFKIISYTQSDYEVLIKTYATNNNNDHTQVWYTLRYPFSAYA